jgi:hypothetical protein
VILNDVSDYKDNIRKPNANVYYEYGLMTAFRKEIIPIQLIDQTLAFNIQSLDTLKYNPKNFASQIEEAVKMTLLSQEEKHSEEKKQVDENKVEWTLDLMGLVRGEGVLFNRMTERALYARSLGFKGYVMPQNERLYYVGIFSSNEKDTDVILRAKMLTMRIKNYCAQITNEIDELERTTERRPRTIVQERIAEQQKLRGRLLESCILIYKEDLIDREALIRTYKSSVAELDFHLQIDILDDEKIKEALEL